MKPSRLYPSALLAVALFTSSAIAQDAVSSVTPSKAEVNAAQNETHQLAILTVSVGGYEEQIIIKLRDDQAPRTVQNFVDNIKKGTYEGLAFHRSIPNYLVQTGDPNSRNDGTRDQWGLGESYTIPGEFSLPHKVGAVAMARRSDAINPQRASNGTQFYIALDRMSQLDNQYTVFGEVVAGLDVAKRISQSLRDTNDIPLERIEIVDAKVIQHKGPVAQLTQRNSDKARRSTTPAPSGPFGKFLKRVW